MLAALLACLVALAVAGCGGDDSSSGGLGAALSYVPADTPFAVAIDTDLDGDQYKAADAILNKFPGADTIKSLLKAQLEMGQEGVKFDDDIKPLLGNPAVISATDVSSFLSDSEQAGFVAALQVEDKDALDSLIDKTKPKKLRRGRRRNRLPGRGHLLRRRRRRGGAGRVARAGQRPRSSAPTAGTASPRTTSRRALTACPTSRSRASTSTSRACSATSEGATAARRIPWVDALRTLGLTRLGTRQARSTSTSTCAPRATLSDADLPARVRRRAGRGR